MEFLPMPKELNGLSDRVSSHRFPTGKSSHASVGKKIGQWRRSGRGTARPNQTQVWFSPGCPESQGDTNSEVVDKLVQNYPKLPDDGGEIPKSQARGWRFDSQLWNLLSTWRKTCQVVVNCLLCFGVGLSTLCLKNKLLISSVTLEYTSKEGTWPYYAFDTEYHKQCTASDGHCASDSQPFVGSTWLRLRTLQ